MCADVLNTVQQQCILINRSNASHVNDLSTWLAQSVMGRTSDPDLVRAHRPPSDIIRHVLLVNSPNKFNLLQWLLIYLCNKNVLKGKPVLLGVT